MPMTRLLAATLQQNPYITVSDFFAGLTDEELDKLMDIAEEDDHDSYGDLILMTEMLTAAEGVDVDEEDDDVYVDNITHRLKMFITFITLESLERKQLIYLHRENMSFGEDYSDKIIAEPRK